MSIRDRQVEFAKMLPRLIERAFDAGYEVTLGDAYRDDRVHGIYGEKQAYGKAYSKHKLRLAIDLNLFKDGKYLTETDEYLKIGIWWESVGGIWGGRFDDGNHFEWRDK